MLVQDVSRRFFTIADQNRKFLELLLKRALFNTQKHERPEEKCPMPTDLREEADSGKDSFANTQQ